MVVGFYRGIVSAKYVNLRSMHTPGFEFLFDSVEVIQILAYIEMPFHLVCPVVTSCKSEYAGNGTESSCPD